MAERHGSRTHPGQDHCPADGFEDRGGHRTTSRSVDTSCHAVGRWSPRVTSGLGVAGRASSPRRFRLERLPPICGGKPPPEPMTDHPTDAYLRPSTRPRRPRPPPHWRSARARSRRPTPPWRARHQEGRLLERRCVESEDASVGPRAHHGRLVLGGRRRRALHHLLRRVTDVLGYTPDEIIGRSPVDLMVEEDVAAIGPVFERMPSEGTGCSELKNRNRHKDGHEVVLSHELRADVERRRATARLPRCRQRHHAARPGGTLAGARPGSSRRCWRPDAR